MDPDTPTITIDEILRWGDMDAFGHVNNAVFFRYFESARIAYFEALALERHCREAGLGPILAHTRCDFLVPLVYPDRVRVGVRTARVGTKSFTHAYTLTSEKRGLAARGEGVIVMYHYATGATAPLPASLRAAIDALEATAAGPRQAAGENEPEA